MGIDPSTRANQLLFPTQFQLICQRQVAWIVVPAQISEQATALADHLEQTPAAGFIVLVGAQMIGQLEDAGGQNRYLNFRRAGVALVTVVVGDDLGFNFLIKRHDVCNSFSRDFEQVSAPAG